jgi:hypothetical protein
MLDLRQPDRLLADQCLKRLLCGDRLITLARLAQLGRVDARQSDLVRTTRSGQGKAVATTVSPSITDSTWAMIVVVGAA